MVADFLFHLLNLDNADYMREATEFKDSSTSPFSLYSWRQLLAVPNLPTGNYPICKGLVLNSPHQIRVYCGAASTYLTSADMFSMKIKIYRV